MPNSLPCCFQYWCSITNTQCLTQQNAPACSTSGGDQPFYQPLETHRHSFQLTYIFAANLSHTMKIFRKNCMDFIVSHCDPRVFSSSKTCHKRYSEAPALPVVTNSSIILPNMVTFSHTQDTLDQISFGLVCISKIQIQNGTYFLINN